MIMKRTLSAIMIIVLAIVVFSAFSAWNGAGVGWAHILGLGASIMILALIWFWPESRQPTQPPP